MTFHNVDATPTAGPVLATTANGRRGAALAIDGRTGYLYVIEDSAAIYRYDGSSGVGVNTGVVVPPGITLGNQFARATIVNGVLLVMPSATATVAANVSTYTVHRYSINEASGALTALPSAVVNLPIGNAGGTLGGGDIAQDDTTDRIFMMVNITNGTGNGAYFYELPASLYSSSAGNLTATGVPLNNGTPRTGLALVNYGGFAIYRGEFYVGSNNGSMGKLPSDLGNNPARVTLGTPSNTTGNASSVDLAACGIPAFTLTKAGQAFLADGTTASPFAVEGGFVQYTVQVQNVGSTVAEGSTFRDALPAGTSYVASSATLNGTGISGSANPFATSRAVNSPGRVAGSVGYAAASNTATITYRVRVDTLTGPLVNTATAAFTSPIASATPDCSLSPQRNCATRSIPASAQLTLSKTIAAPGRANTADQFTLRIRNGGTDIATASTTGTNLSATTVVQPVALGSTYTLDEVMAAGSTSTLAGYTTTISCTNVGGNAATVLPAGAGQSFTVTPQAGDNIACTLTNTRQTRLTLAKTVVNDNGGTQAAGAWTLTAAGPTNLSGGTASAAVTNAAVAPGDYSLGETGPAGYAASAYSCVRNGAAAVIGNALTLAAGDVASCTITNNDQPATLTLVKTVTNDNGGTQLATAWNLQAAGPSPINGSTGNAAVTNATVNAGVYTLSETGPANYVAGAWACSGGVLSGNTLTLGNGQSASCSINNNDSNQANLSVTKTNSTTSLVSGTTTTYTVTATNEGPALANGATVSDAPTQGLGNCSVPPAGCTASGGAVCPATPSAVLAPAGVAIPTFPAAGQVVFTIQCTVR